MGELAAGGGGGLFGGILDIFKKAISGPGRSMQAWANFNNTLNTGTPPNAGGGGTGSSADMGKILKQLQELAKNRQSPGVGSLGVGGALGGSAIGDPSGVGGMAGMFGM